MHLCHLVSNRKLFKSASREKKTDMVQDSGEAFLVYASKLSQVSFVCGERDEQDVITNNSGCVRGLKIIRIVPAR